MKKLFVISAVALCVGFLLFATKKFSENETVLLLNTGQNDVFYYKVSCFRNTTNAPCIFSRPNEKLVELFCKVEKCLPSQKAKYYEQFPPETLVALAKDTHAETFSILTCAEVFGPYNVAGIIPSFSFELFAVRIEGSYEIAAFGGFDVYKNYRNGNWLIAQKNQPPRHICYGDGQEKLDAFIKYITQSQI